MKKFLAVLLLLGMVFVTSATADVIGPFDEDKIYFRVFKSTGVMFENHLAAGSTWYISSRYNYIWSWDEYWDDLETYYNNSQEEFIATLDRSPYGIGVTEDNRCDACKMATSRNTTEVPPPEF